MLYLPSILAQAQVRVVTIERHYSLGFTLLVGAGLLLLILLAVVGIAVASSGGRSPRDPS